MSLTAPTVRVRAPKQSAADRAAVYAYVTFRERWDCAAWKIDPEQSFFQCHGRRERHHAGNTIGSKRITDARHVVLLCEFHHRTWAPSHSRLILEFLDRVETERESHA